MVIVNTFTMARRIKCDFLHHNGIIDQQWFEQWVELESWLDSYTPGWTYVQVDNFYCLEFARESDLTMYVLRWAN